MSVTMNPTERPQRVIDLLKEALGLPTEEREAFLAEASQGDPDLRQQVESLLHETMHNGRARSDDATDLSDTEAPVDERWLQFLNRFRAQTHPTRIGTFRILHLLGEGGMGAVYLAEQQKPVARRVALKLIHASLRTPQALVRFDAERNALARLSHPNVAVLHEAGTTEDGFPYFAMEYVEGGEALTTYCDRHQLSIRQRLELFLDVCRGVQHAHQKGILHRDLKPSNVLVTDKESTVVKVIDFSLAKSVDASPLSEQTQLTRGLAVGTPAYMSPEAWDTNADLDTRTDVFSLGVMLYELLVGTRPGVKSGTGITIRSSEFDGDEVILPSIKARQATGEVLSARQATSQELDRRLSGDLDWILRRALASDRDERYPTVFALMEDVGRHLRDEPVSVGPPTWRYKARKFFHRHRIGVMASLSVLVLLLAAAGAIWQARREAESKTRLAAELNREVERIEWLQRVTHQLPLGIAGAEGPIIRDAMKHIQTRLDQSDAGLAAYALGRGALALGDPVTARSHFEAALQKGYDAPEVKLALGWALSDLYDRRLDTLRRSRYPDERQAEQQKADRELRQPALQLLEQSSISAWIAPELLAAKIALQQENFDLAIEQGRQAAARLGWLYEARFLVGRALLRQGEKARDDDKDLDRAEAFFEAAAKEVEIGLQIGRSDPEGHRLLCAIFGIHLPFAVRYARPGVDALHQQTMAACQRAQQANPENLEPILVQAWAWLGLAEVQLWDRGEDPHPSLDRVDDLLGEVVEQEIPSGTSRQISEASKVLGRAASTRAIYADREGEDPRPASQKAAEHLERAITLDPTAADSHFRLAEVLTERATWAELRGIDPGPDLERALEAARQAIVLRPEMFEALHGLGRAHFSLAYSKIKRGIAADDDLANAETAFRRALAVEPNSLISPGALAAVKILQAKLLRKHGEDSEEVLTAAIEILENAIPRAPDPTYLWLQTGQCNLGLAWNRLKRGEDPSEESALARQMFEKGIEALPQVAGGWIELAEIYLVEARWALSQGQSSATAVTEAVSHARHGLELDALRADAQLNIGLAWLIQASELREAGADRAMSRARAALERAIEMEPESAPNRIAFARWVWTATQDDRVKRDGELWQHGLEHAAEAERLDPFDAEATLLRGALLTLDPANRAEGEAMIGAARERNTRLVLDWRRGE